MKNTHEYIAFRTCFCFCLCLMPVGDLHAGAVCAESPVLAVETRAFGVCLESSIIAVDTRTKFDLWIAGSSLTGDSSNELAEPFGDGVTNLVKYAFNLNGGMADAHVLIPQGTSGLPYPRAEPGKLVLVALRRKDDSGLIYKAQFSQNLATWAPVTQPSQITSIDAIWERVMFESPIPQGGSDRWFGRVDVLYMPP